MGNEKATSRELTARRVTAAAFSSSSRPKTTTRPPANTGGTTQGACSTSRPPQSTRNSASPARAKALTRWWLEGSERRLRDEMQTGFDALAQRLDKLEVEYHMLVPGL